MTGLILLLLIAAPVSMQMYPSAKEVRVGEPFNLEIEITGPADAEIVSMEPSDPSVHLFSFKKDGSRGTAKLAVYKTGKAEVPFKLYYTVSGQPGETESKGFSVLVTTTAAEGDTVIGPRGPAAAADPVYILIIAGVLLLAASAIYQTGRKRKTEPQQVMSPYEKAKSRLNDIKESGIAEKGDYKGYYDAISDCIRMFVDDKYGLKTLGATLSEMQQILKTSEEMRGTSGKVSELLRECDHIKFAPEGRAPITLETVWKTADGLIDEV